MKEHLSPIQIEHLVRRQSAAEELLQFTRHTAICETCRPAVEARFRAIKSMRERLAALRAELDPRKDPPTPHLSYEQVTDYVEGNLNETHAAIVEQHLGLCPQCQFETTEFQQYYTSLRQEPPPAPPPLPEPILEQAREEIPPVVQVVPPARKLSSFGTMRGWRPMGWALAGSLTIVLIGAELWLSRSRSAPSAPIARRPISQAQTPPLIPRIVVSPSLQPSPEPIQADALAVLTDHGRQIRLERNGSLTGLPELPEPLSRSIKQLLTTQRPEIPNAELQTLRGRAGALLDGKRTTASESIKLLKPVGVITMEDQPTFSWVPVAGAQQYTVTLLNTDYIPVITTIPLSQSTWRPPLPIPRDRAYVWQVTTEVNGKTFSSSSATAPEARFKVLSAERYRQLRHAAEQYHESHLILGTLYAQAGLLEEANHEFQALASANPQSQLARTLARQTKR